MANTNLSTVNASKQRQPMCSDCENSLPNQIVFDKIESIISSMQVEENGLPVKTAKSFMSKIPSVFTGQDLIQWLMRHLELDDQQEAIHLANLIASHGYIFPIEDHTLSIKNDCTFYRFQTPCLWPSNNNDPENTDYAVYLCKRTMQGKTRLELADYEAENLARLQKMFSRKWEFIFMQAESQAKVDKKRDKLERKVLDSQERAFWDVHRPVPGCVNTTEMDIKKACRLSKAAKNCPECQKVIAAASQPEGARPEANAQPEPLTGSTSSSSSDRRVQIVERAPETEPGKPEAEQQPPDTATQAADEAKPAEPEEQRGVGGCDLDQPTHQTVSHDKQPHHVHYHAHRHHSHHHGHHHHAHHHHHNHNHNHSRRSACPHHKQRQPTQAEEGEQAREEEAPPTPVVGAQSSPDGANSPSAPDSSVVAAGTEPTAQSVAARSELSRPASACAGSVAASAPTIAVPRHQQLQRPASGAFWTRKSSLDLVERGKGQSQSHSSLGPGSATMMGGLRKGSFQAQHSATGSVSSAVGGDPMESQLERDLDALSLTKGPKMSKVTQSYLSYFKQWAEYDPFVSQPIPSNPWCSDSTELWDLERQTKEVHCRRVRRWAFSLKELLNDPAGREQFYRFLEKEFSAENLEFWDAVQDLKRVHSRDVARRVEAIWTEYLAQDANCPINIDSKSYETSKRNMAKNKNNRYIFDEAAGHVYQLMKNDSYPRYLRSDMYKDYREASERKRPNQVAFDVFKPQINTLKQKFNF